MTGRCKRGLAAAVVITGLTLCAGGAASLAQERPMVLDETTVPKGRPAPRTSSGKPDLSGYWKGTRQTRPGGNIGKDLPGWKLPLGSDSAIVAGS